MLAIPKLAIREASTAGPGNFEREALLESGNSVHTPAGDYFVHDTSSITHIPLAVAEGQVVNVANNQALRDVLRRQRALACEIVVVLHLPQPRQSSLPTSW